MSRFFGKLKQGTTRFFNKIGHEAPKILGTISQGLSSGSKFINKVGDIAQGIANNPITLSIAPEISAGVNALTNGLRGVSNLASQGSRLTNAKSYRGDANQVSNNILERARTIKNDAQKVKFV
jgi:hypothetical protein